MAIINIINENILKYENSILNILLKDRTTNQNIIWATNDYLKLGKMYTLNQEITIKLIMGSRSKIVKPRIIKSQINQNIRKREKAEVFTPSWLCNKQNNLIDEKWFCKKDIFNIELNTSWKTNYDKIKFPNNKNLTWKKYIDANRMEITCGEAPYLVSRYDSVSGKTIDIKNRIGLLDRKLRIVNENVNDEINWLKWVERAFQSVYGYEYQGDNLILARQNLLYTFIDNIEYKLNRKPTINELKKISTIISWNIWQMDGMTYKVPLHDKRDWMEQLDFLNFNNNNNNKYCKIKDWRSNKILEYRYLVKGDR